MPNYQFIGICGLIVVLLQQVVAYRGFTTAPSSDTLHCSQLNASSCGDVKGCAFCNASKIDSYSVCYNTSTETCCLWSQDFPVCPLHPQCAALPPDACSWAPDCLYCGITCYNTTTTICCAGPENSFCPANSTCCFSSLNNECCGPETQCCASSTEALCCDSATSQCCIDDIADQAFCCPANGSCCGYNCCDEGEICCGDYNSVVWCCAENQTCGNYLSDPYQCFNATASPATTSPPTPAPPRSIKDRV